MIAKTMLDNILNLIQYFQRKCYGTEIGMTIAVRKDSDGDNTINVTLSKNTDEDYYEHYIIVEDESFNPYDKVEEISNELIKQNIKLF